MSYGIGMGHKISNERLTSLQQGAFFGTGEEASINDAYVVSNADDEFSDWDTWTIAIWLNCTGHIDWLASGTTDYLMSLGPISHKGFTIAQFNGSVKIIVGNGSSSIGTYTDPLSGSSLTGTQPPSSYPGEHILIVGRRDAAANTNKIFARTAHSEFSGSDTGGGAHWGDPGTDVSLAFGGRDTASSGIFINQDWRGNSRVSQAGMWKEYLSDANITSIWNSHNSKLDKLGIGTMRHHWVFNHNPTNTAPVDRITTAAKNLSINDDAKIRSW